MDHGPKRALPRDSRERCLSAGKLLPAVTERYARAGFHLIRRPAIYPEFINDDWVAPATLSAAIQFDHGF